MKLVKSKKLKLPVLYYISDRAEIAKLPIGVPFIYGSEKDYRYTVQLLEWEILYKAAMASGFKFNFEKILKDNGYRDLKRYSYDKPLWMDYVKVGNLTEEYELEDRLVETISGDSLFKDYINDVAVKVDIDKLKDLNVFPIWLDTIEDAITTNIHNFSVFNPYMYCKKLDGMYGGLDLSSPKKNLIIVDISSSIPKGVSSTVLSLAKNLMETFYADLMITGSHTSLYTYEDVHTLDIETIYEVNGTANEGFEYRALVTADDRHYATVIAFGDNHSPCDSWWANGKCDEISREDAQKMCKWKVDKLISFHTTSTKETAGYADFFTPKETVKIADWVKYL